MSNITKMEIQQSITALCNQGWSERRIARELGIHRQTVRRYVSGSKCTNPHTGKKGPVSQCEPHRDHIKEAYESGLSIERIHQDLTVNHAFTGSYHSLRRFVKTLHVSIERLAVKIENSLRSITHHFVVSSGACKTAVSMPVGSLKTLNCPKESLLPTVNISIPCMSCSPSLSRFTI